MQNRYEGGSIAMVRSFQQIRNNNKINIDNNHFKKHPNSSLHQNPQSQIVQLPSITRKRQASGSLLSQRNTRFKLSNLEQKMIQLKAEVHNTRLDAKQLIENVNGLKQLLLQTELTQHKQQIRKQINGLNRLVQITRRNNEDRTKELRNDCNNLWDQTQQMRQMVFEMRMRMDQMEDNMGYLKQMNS